jgi:hypothetical protein
MATVVIVMYVHVCVFVCDVLCVCDYNIRHMCVMQATAHQNKYYLYLEKTKTNVTTKFDARMCPLNSAPACDH